MQVFIKDDNTEAVPMDLDALNMDTESSKEGKEKEKHQHQQQHQQEEDGEQHQHQQEEEGEVMYGDDGCLYFMTPKGKSKGKGKSGFDGKCNWCGKYGHRLRDCHSYTAYLQKEGTKEKEKAKDGAWMEKAVERAGVMEAAAAKDGEAKGGRRKGKAKATP